MDEFSFNLLQMVKGRERYVIAYPDDRKNLALGQLGSWAANPELSFTWYDCAVLSSRVRHPPDNFYPPPEV